MNLQRFSDGCPEFPLTNGTILNFGATGIEISITVAHGRQDTVGYFPSHQLKNSTDHAASYCGAYLIRVIRSTLRGTDS